MDIKRAVVTAIAYVQMLYVDETVEDIGLEEIEYDTEHKRWLVTIGFTRSTKVNKLLTGLGGVTRRSYKLVTIDDTKQEPISLRDRELSH